MRGSIAGPGPDFNRPPRSVADYRALAWAFLRLGCISFGGPVAHIGYLREEFVARRRWITDERFGDLTALCQFLPGPASSQLVFALGMERAGLAGAAIASACFTLPSALLMILFAYGVNAWSGTTAAGWLEGLKIAAVAIVAQSVWQLGRKLCPDRLRIIIALFATLAVLSIEGAFTQPALIAVGAMIGWLFYPSSGERRSEGGRHIWSALALLTFGAVLLLGPIVARLTGDRSLLLFDAFYRAGSMVFGGGHVVLPLLRAELVSPGWIDDNLFLAGYGAVQAVPGPLFSFAAYLGTVISPGPQAWMSGLFCLFALFLPGWLLVGGVLPFWQSLRSRAWARGALNGANAAVVGILLAALYDPIWKEGVSGPLEFLLAIAAFVLLQVLRSPPWALVLASATVGQWLL